MIHRLFYKKNRCFSLFRAYALLLFALFVASCSDSGCIDADDFGEYESQTIEVEANAAQENCTFNYGKDLIDTSHGAGIKDCLTAGDVEITDENDVMQPSSHGCLDYETNANNAKYKNLCINYCVDLCNANSSRNSISAEPAWTSTDAKVSGKNSGVTIRPGSQISIRAVGNISVGEAIDYPDIFVKATESAPHSQKRNWTDHDDAFFDARKNQSLFVKFSGSWLENSANSATQVGAGNLTPDGGANDRIIYNGAKRLVIYAAPHPEGYSFDVNALTEQAGTIGVPLLPDPEAWVCAYNGGSMVESACNNSPTGYTGMGYTNANNSLTNTIYPISSQFKAVMLSENGGMIRWAGDDLLPDSYDPFLQNSVACNGTTGNCTNISNVNPNQGRIIGSLANSSVEIVNNQSAAFKVSFKSLVSDNGCNINLNSVSIFNGATSIKTFSNVGITNTTWSDEHITLEPNQKIVIAQNSQMHSGLINCGALIGVKFAKYHDIAITQSGLVRFTMLRASGSTCTINGRIINPTGTQSPFSGLEPDYYEYAPFYEPNSSAPDPFRPGEDDPMEFLSVPSSPTTAVPGAMVWSNEVFVRKGQTIRFSPESWNGNWSANDTSLRSCGIGMAMHIKPRPALLCRGQATDLIDNTDCIPLYQGATLIGCQEIEPSCSNISGGNYCPDTCNKPITCTSNGNAANNFTRTGCVLGAEPGTCSYAGVGASHTIGSCASCNNLRLTNASKSAKIGVSAINQCYDLEKYTGSVKNISSSTTQTKDDVDTFLANATLSKGAQRLESFNGQYGNFGNFTSSANIDTIGSNVIYQLRSPVTLTQSSRIKFFVLDGDSFNESGGVFSGYNDNSSAGSSYGGANGFKVNVSGTLEFNNGVWLQARLCLETNSTTSICKNSNPVALTTQPQIIEITPPTAISTPGAAPTLTAGSNYRINDFGNVIRTSSLGAATGDCTAGVTGIENFSGATFYCHTHQYFNKTQFAAKTTSERDAINGEVSRLRLTFKIIDPEVGNCDITGVNDGIKSNNPFYDPATPSNVGAICTAAQIPGNNSLASPGTCTKEYYCANRYSNNSGKYFVSVRVKNLADGNISNIIGSVINPIVEIMDGKRDNPDTAPDESTMGQAERVYRLLISDSRYQAILTICLVTMFTFYGFGYLIGVVEMSHADIINRIIKIGLIYLFVGETGWEWFNKIIVKLFKDSTDYIAFMMASSFDESPELRNAIAGGNFYDKSVLFSSVDKVFGLFFASAVQKKISALLFASIFGWAYLMIIYSSFMLYVFAVSNAVLLYLTAQVFISILFVLGPIFFVFTLFSQTKEMFDNWLKQLIGFSLQQIFLLTTLAFFNMLMYEVIKMSLGYKICWDEVWTLNIITRITLLSFWTIASLPPRTNQHSEVGNIGNPEGIPSLFTILFIWVIASLMHKFISFMTDLAGGIAGGLKASSLGSGVAAFAKEMRAGASKMAGKISSTIGLDSPMRKLDKALFDSGKLAEEARGKKRKQNSMDLNNKNAMSKAGDAAMKDYMVNNAAAYSKLDEAGKRDALKDARTKGMDAEGKKLGLDEATIKRLKSDTGNKYVGSNVFAYGLQAARQGLSSGGSLNTSLDNQKIDTSFSHDAGQKAMKKMTKPERDEFISNVEDGKTHVESSALNKIRHNKLRTLGAVATLGGSEAFMKAKSAVSDLASDSKFKSKAAKELESSGIISRNKAGFSRTDEDKQLIAERAQEMKESAVKNKGITSHGAAELRREANYIDKKTEIGENDASLTSKVGSYVSTGAKRLFRADNLNTDAKSSAKDKLKSKLQGDKARIQSEREGLEEDYNVAADNYDDSQEKVKGTDSHKKMTELEKKDDLSRGEKKQLARLKQAVNINKDSNEAKEAAASANQINSQLSALKEREEEIDEALTELDAPPKEGLASRAKKFASNLFKKKDGGDGEAGGGTKETDA